MSKNFKIIVFLIVIILVIAAIFVVRAKENELLRSIENKIVYFYGEGCPHCENVEEFLKENDVESKIEFEKKEIYSNKANVNLLILAAKKKCGFKENEIGVPLLWNGSGCLVGDIDIIDFFKQKIQG